MPIRLAHFYGAGHELVAAAEDAWVAFRSNARAARVAHWEVSESTLAIGLLLVWIALMAAANALHEYGLRARIARDGCPYAADADPHRLPGAREREFAERYC